MELEWLVVLIDYWVVGGGKHTQHSQRGSKTRFTTLSTKKEVKENILLQRQRWPGRWILRNRHTWAQLPTPQERKTKHTLSIPSPHQQQRSLSWPWSHKGSLQGRLPCTPLLPAAWTGRREKKGKRWPKGSRLLWSNSCLLTICEQEVKKLLNSTVYTLDHLSHPGLLPKCKPHLFQVQVLLCYLPSLPFRELNVQLCSFLYPPLFKIYVNVFIS